MSVGHYGQGWPHYEQLYETRHIFKFMAIPRHTVMILVLCTLSDNAQELCHIIPNQPRDVKVMDKQVTARTGI